MNPSGLLTRSRRLPALFTQTVLFSVLLLAMLLSLVGNAAAEPAGTKDRLPGAADELTVVGSFNNYNEVLRGTAKRNPGGWGVITLKGEVTGLECEGKGALGYDPKREDCNGAMGIARIRCSDGRLVQAETTWSSCTRAVSVGFDQFGNQLTFISGHTAEIADKLFAAEKDAASKRPSLAYAPSKVRSDRGYVTGTGFFVSEQGHLITNYRLVDGASELTVIDHKGTRLPATVIEKDETHDVALLKVESASQKLTVRNDRGLARGTELFTLGYPLIAVERQQQQMTFGELAASKDVAADERFLQLDLAVRPGNCGGPLMDGTGAVVGAVLTPLDPARAAEGEGAIGYNIGYAVKAHHLAPLLKAAGVEMKTGSSKAASAEKEADLRRAAEGAVVLVVTK
jgi:S1-C subfamily serine protease